MDARLCASFAKHISLKMSLIKAMMLPILRVFAMDSIYYGAKQNWYQVIWTVLAVISDVKTATEAKLYQGLKNCQSQMWYVYTKMIYYKGGLSSAIDTYKCKNTQGEETRFYEDWLLYRSFLGMPPDITKTMWHNFAYPFRFSVSHFACTVLYIRYLRTVLQMAP